MNVVSFGFGVLFEEKEWVAREKGDTNNEL